MTQSIDQVFGLPAAALELRARRSEVLAANLANADTPHFKARDFDLGAAMREVSGQGVQLAANEPGQIQPASMGVQQTRLLYRVPQNPSLDGNTVETQVEQAKFAENAVQYRAALTFLNARISGLINALQSG